MSVYPITAAVGLVKVVSLAFLYCRVTTFPCVVNKVSFREITLRLEISHYTFTHQFQILPSLYQVRSKAKDYSAMADTVRQRYVFLSSSLLKFDTLRTQW